MEASIEQTICFGGLAAMNMKVVRVFFSFSVLQQRSGTMYLWPCPEGSF